MSLLYMFIAVIFFFLMSICVKKLDHIPISQLVFFRASIALLICLIQLKIKRVSPWGNNKILLFYRGIFGAIAVVLFFTTLHHMPISTAFSIQFLSPIFVTILSLFILKKKVFPLQWLFFLMAFIGILFIKEFSPNISPSIFVIGICSAICSAAAYTCINKIKNSEHSLVIVFYFPFLTTILILPFAVLNWFTPNLYEWGILILIGILVHIGQYFMTLSYQNGEPSRVSIISYTAVFYGLLADIFIFSMAISAKSLIGICFILIGIIGNTLYTRFKTKAAI